MKTMRAAAAAMVAIGVLAGCSAQPGTAAVVNGASVSENDVDALAQEIAGVGASRSNALNIALTVAVIEPIVEKGYSDQLTPEFLTDSLESCTTQIGMEVTEDSTQTLQQYCHLVALATSDTDFASEANDAISAAKVSLNPRYGSDDSDTGLPNYLTDADRSATTDSDTTTN